MLFQSFAIVSKHSISSVLYVIMNRTMSYLIQISNIEFGMGLSGLNKALHLLHSTKVSAEKEASTRQEIVFNANMILGKMKECDFKVVTENALQAISSQCYEVYVILTDMNKMLEIVDADTNGMYRKSSYWKGSNAQKIYP